ncbi:copper homeostasis protein cutC homolog [Dermatophagoides pteronyssinus]|uniref:copper homeostasis protein cutC homolog n=1 Tax=Dermatophagoides pteronyssinus TaxID=6956 RepID=UPI003F679467
MAPKIEICVDNFESIREAVKGGAKRIELCSALKEGGLTPSLGFLKFVKQQFSKELLIVFPMIRPRGGDFNYSAEELKIMANDIECMRENGYADGFVFGCLQSDGTVDLEANRFLLEKAKPLPCTFHRAFDMVADWEKSLEDIIHLGFKRILTSGRAATAIDGLEQIQKLIELADGRIIIMPGSGINVANLAQILRTTKTQEYHCSASRIQQSKMIYRNEQIQMGKSNESNEFELKICDSILVKRMIEIASKF